MAMAILYNYSGLDFVIRSPVLRTARSYVLRMFLFIFPQLTFSQVRQPIFFSTRRGFSRKKKRCYVSLVTVPPNKNEERKPPNFA